jgi:alpha-galactosidase
MFDAQQKVFHLQGKGTSYIIQILRDGYLVHMYWGKRVEHYHESNPLVFFDRGFSPNPDPSDRTFSLDTIPQEYPAYGNSDFRNPALQIQFENSSTIIDLRYKSHRIFDGKPKLNGLPATYVQNDTEAETLEITMEDSLTKFTVLLTYTVFRDFDAIARSVMLCNNSVEDVKIKRAFSSSVDFRDDKFDFMTLYGAHNNERNIARRPVVSGTQLIDSCRGASSHQQNPFFALLRPNADEDHGEVFGFNLVYSGNFSAQVQVDQFRNTRANIGINPFDFEWLLKPGENFQTPEAVMVYSSQGLGEMSRTYHELYRSRLCRGLYRDAERPILVNNWEATYFNFDSDKLKQIATTAKKLGIELFVLDDGWFGNRSDDLSSLGDWFVDKSKLPNGLSDIADFVSNLGMKFGLWFEPEMISVNSDLYRVHPDWCLHVPNRVRTESRNQLILDLSRVEVCEYIIKSVSNILSSAKISYVKWDMNRHMTEIGSASLPAARQRETAHRYMLGLYHVLEQITSQFPHILFESCSGGGGRFDPGMLYYMPQTWASDNTDAISRLKIQYGTSIVYPVSTICSHVSDIPNHQIGRITPLETRGNVSMSGNFGYELDLTKLTEAEKNDVKEQIAVYKQIRTLIQFGKLFRLLSPFDGNEAAWNFVSSDQTQAAVFYFKTLSLPSDYNCILKFKGLNPGFLYELFGTGKTFMGDELMNIGMTMPVMEGDFRSRLFMLKKV